MGIGIVHTKQMVLSVFLIYGGIMNGFYRKIQDGTSLTYEKDIDLFYGQKDGYHFVHKMYRNSGGIISFSISNASLPEKEVMKQAKKECPAINSVTLQEYRVDFGVKSGMSQKKIVENIQTAIDFLIDFFKRGGYLDASELSGSINDVDIYFVGGDVKIITAEEFRLESQKVRDREETTKMKSENVVAGIVGSFIGSLIGVAVILFFSKLGYVTVLGGLAMGVCTTKGYEVLSGKFTKKGIVIALIIMIGMTYLANRLSWALEASAVLEIGVFESFQALHEIIEVSEIVDLYWIELGKLALFTAAGAIPSVYFMSKSVKERGFAYKLGSYNQVNL